MLRIEKSEQFSTDVVHQFGWYHKQAGDALAFRFLSSVDSTIIRIAVRPDLGRKRNFAKPALQGLRSFAVAAPFERLLVFYRATPEVLQLWRLMHGARDLQRKLVHDADD